MQWHTFFSTCPCFLVEKCFTASQRCPSGHPQDFHPKPRAALEDALGHDQKKRFPLYGQRKPSDALSESFFASKSSIDSRRCTFHERLSRLPFRRGRGQNDGINAHSLAEQEFFVCLTSVHFEPPPAGDSGVVRFSNGGRAFRPD